MDTLPSDNTDRAEQEDSDSSPAIRTILVPRPLIEQLEFYFSEASLSRNAFLRRVLQNHDGAVPFRLLASFKRIKNSINGDDELLRAAVEASNELTISADGSMVQARRAMLHRSMHIPADQTISGAKQCNVSSNIAHGSDPTAAELQRQTESAQRNTVYVEWVPIDCTVDSLHDQFACFGPVAYVDLPRYPRTKQVKGFAFIQFAEHASTQRALDHFASSHHAKQSQSPAKYNTNATDIPTLPPYRVISLKEWKLFKQMYKNAKRAATPTQETPTLNTVPAAPENFVKLYGSFDIGQVPPDILREYAAMAGPITGVFPYNIQRNSQSAAMPDSNKTSSHHLTTAKAVGNSTKRSQRRDLALIQYSTPEYALFSLQLLRYQNIVIKGARLRANKVKLDELECFFANRARTHRQRQNQSSAAGSETPTLLSQDRSVSATATCTTNTDKRYRNVPTESHNVSSSTCASSLRNSSRDAEQSIHNPQTVSYTESKSTTNTARPSQVINLEGEHLTASSEVLSNITIESDQAESDHATTTEEEGLNKIPSPSSRRAHPAKISLSAQTVSAGSHDTSAPYTSTAQIHNITSTTATPATTQALTNSSAMNSDTQSSSGSVASISSTETSSTARRKQETQLPLEHEEKAFLRDTGIPSPGRVNNAQAMQKYETIHGDIHTTSQNVRSTESNKVTSHVSSATNDGSSTTSSLMAPETGTQYIHGRRRSMRLRQGHNTSSPAEPTSSNSRKSIVSKESTKSDAGTSKRTRKHPKKTKRMNSPAPQTEHTERRSKRARISSVPRRKSTVRRKTHTENSASTKSLGPTVHNTDSSSRHTPKPEKSAASTPPSSLRRSNRFRSQN